MALPRPCLKRCTSNDVAASPAKKRVVISTDANELKLVAYYGRPEHSPDLAKQCFYTEYDCAHAPSIARSLAWHLSCRLLTRL